MPCMCGTTKVSSDSGTLTENEISLVQTTWKVLYGDWEQKHGVTFLLRFFKTYPVYKTYFEAFKDQPDDQLADNDRVIAHAKVFGVTLDKLIVNLADTTTVVDVLHKLTDSHGARGIGVSDFKVALDVFAGFASETAKLTKEQQNAWIKMIRVVMKVITDYANELSKET